MPVKEISIGKIPVNRAVVNLIRGDNRTQIIRLLINRYDGGVDLANLSWAIYAVNANGASDVYYLPDAVVTDDMITVDWLVYGVATAVAGETRFELEGISGDDAVVVRQGGTRVIKVYDDLNAVPAIDETALSSLQQLIAYIDEELPSVLKARDAANTAAIKAENTEKINSQNEIERIGAEQGRIQAENQRKEDESARVIVEEKRAANETERVNEEAKRAASELMRIDNEKSRALAEDARKSAEVSRAQEETMRQNAEKMRVIAESTRTTAESGRQNYENTRRTAEQERAAAEFARSQSWTELQTNVSAATNDAENAARTANDAAQNAAMATADASQAASAANTAVQGLPDQISQLFAALGLVKVDGKICVEVERS